MIGLRHAGSTRLLLADRLGSVSCYVPYLIVSGEVGGE